MTRPGAVLLDFFGTTAVHRSADDWIDAAATGDAPSDAERAIARERLGSVWADAAESFPAGSWDLDPDTHRQAFVQTITRAGGVGADFATRLYEAMPDQVSPNEGVLEFVATVAGHGVPLAVVSNTGIDVRPILRRWGIERSFEAVVLSFDVGFVKPDPRIFRLAADALGVPASGCVMIGDSVTDDTGAVAAGMQSITARPEDMWRAFDLVRNGLRR